MGVPKKVLPKPPNAITAKIIMKKKLLSLPDVMQEANSIKRTNNSKNENSPGLQDSIPATWSQPQP